MNKYYIIDSTLREGQQNSQCNFTLQQSKDLLLLLNKFGIEYAELSNPNSSNLSFAEYCELVNFKKEADLDIKLIAHVRNDMADIQKALQSDIECISLFINIPIGFYTKTIDEIIKDTVYNLTFIKQQRPDIEIRLSLENSFVLDQNILSQIFLGIEDYIDRIGITDTLGNVTHYEIEDILDFIKNITTLQLDIECHFHNDSSSAVYNAYIALLNGCTHINTCILGIGERNGITDLSGLISRIYHSNYVPTLEKYNLYILKDLDNFVSNILNIDIPINNPITGLCSFHNKTNTGINRMIKAEQVRLYSTINTNTNANANNFGLFETSFIFSNIMEYTGLKAFLQKSLPKVCEKLTDDYIKKLNLCIKTDIHKNPDLYKLLNEDLEFAIDYIKIYIN